MSRSNHMSNLHQLQWVGLVLALTVLWTCIATPARATEHLVLADGSGPYPNIQWAIDAAAQGDTVVVGAGTYTGVDNRDFNTEEDMLIRAQYPGDEVIIDLQGSAAEPHMGFAQVDGSLSLEGLTIQNAYGIYGAVRARTANFTANNCNFINNTADRGGAVISDGADNLFLNDCVFAGNKATIEGGAIYATPYGEIHLTNCTLFMNECDSGAAIYRLQEATLDMDSCIVAYSRGTYTFSDYYGGPVTALNSNLWGNEGTEWSGLGITPGTNGNITVEPEMCDPMDGNFALTLGSPCAVSPTVIMGGAGQDPLWDVPVYGLRVDGSGMFPTIQAALADVPIQASIALSNGVYGGPGNVSLDFLGKEIELASRSGHAAVLDAGMAGGTWQAIRLTGGEPAGTTVRDLTIRNGRTADNGGGVYVSGGSSLALRNVHFEDNIASLRGGAVAAVGNAGGEVVIDACTFVGNESTFDVYISSGSMWIGNVAFGPTSTGSVVMTSGFGGGTFSNVSVEGCTGISGSIPIVPLTFENCTMVRSGVHGRTSIDGGQDVSFINCDFRSAGTANTELVSLRLMDAIFEDCTFEGLGAAETDVRAVTIDSGAAAFRRSSFTNLNPGEFQGAVSLQNYSSATLDSCTFQQTAAGVVVVDLTPAYATIRDCSFTAVSHPVVFESTPPGRLTITDTEFLVCAQGILVGNIHDVTLTRCGFRGTGPGIPVLAADATMSVTDCEFHDAQVTNDPFFAESGGISCFGSGVTVTGSEFLRNSCELGPGGIKATSGTLTIVDCLFADNTNLPANSGLAPGGAIDCTSVGTFSMTDSRVERNTAFEAGAATISGETITLDNCEVVDNSGTYALGGLVLQPYFTTGSLNMTDCLVAHNTAPAGAGVEIYGSPAAAINRCTVVGNGGPAGAAQIEFGGTGALNLQSSIIAYGDGGAALDCYAPEHLTLTVTCTDIYGNPGGDWTGPLAPFASLGGNLNSDPWFCDMDTGDYHLAADSPCVDTENVCGVTMGAFGVGCGEVSEVPDAPVIQRVALRQNHPNPFNPSTRIKFELPRETAVTLRIYDVAGKLVRELLKDGRHPLGVHEVTWNGRDNAGREQATGMYLYRLETGETVLVRKMALIR